MEGNSLLQKADKDLTTTKMLLLLEDFVPSFVNICLARLSLQTDFLAKISHCALLAKLAEISQFIERGPRPRSQKSLTQNTQAGLLEVNRKPGCL